MDCALASGQAQAVISSVLSDLDEDRDTKVILLNMISSGNRIDRIVSTILPVLQARGTKAGKPLVVHLQGNGGAEATRMLRDAGLPNFDGLKDALHATVEHLGAAR
jgi:succinyl-CoA synthetase beta subunit